MKKLWIFGHSLCLPFNLADTEDGWDRKLASLFQLECTNHASPAVDNFYIYYKFLECRAQIDSNDLVIIGWSHYSRKLFVVNENNSNHKKCFDTSLIYKTENASFMRNQNPVTGNATKWLHMKPKDSGSKFYDNWYNNYYSELEQQINLQSYLESVKYTCPGKYLPFYFSKESVQGVTIDDYHAGFVTEFIIENKISISKDDLHFSAQGHTLWALHLKETIKKLYLENK